EENFVSQILRRAPAGLVAGLANLSIRRGPIYKAIWGFGWR
ncbi:MAG: hypothetical protein RIR41_2520, partial [Pseudomonadota bacterium]